MCVLMFLSPGCYPRRLVYLQRPRKAVLAGAVLTALGCLCLGFLLATQNTLQSCCRARREPPLPGRGGGRFWGLWERASQSDPGRAGHCWEP